VKLDRLLPLSRLVAEETGIPVSPNKSVVGSNAFTTEAGIHQDGLLKDPGTYLPFPPELVGAEGHSLIIGKHSGRAAIGLRLKEMGYDFSPGEVDLIAKEIGESVVAKSADERALLLDAVARVGGKGVATPHE
jgi:2-isopropylmalate synthase